MLSRVADNLYWMSRYLERAQHTARLLDAALTFMLDQSPELIERRWQRTLRSLHVPNLPSDKQPGSTLNPGSDAYALAYHLTFDAGNDVSIFSCVRAARENARQVREEISGEMWECLNRLYLGVRAARPPLETTGLTQSLGGMTQTLCEGGMSQSMGRMMQSALPGNHAFWRQPHEFFADVQRKVFEFEGATDATMRHGEGWLFIQVGRGLEQAAKTASLLNAYFSEPQSESTSTEQDAVHEGNLKWTALLKSCAAFEPYCRVYSPRLSPDKIAEFLLLDEDFPRSVRAAIERIEDSLQSIGELTGKDSLPLLSNQTSTNEATNLRLLRLAGRLKATLDFASLDEIMDGGLPQFLRNIQDDCVRIHSAIYHVYIGYMAE